MKIKDIKKVKPTILLDSFDCIICDECHLAQSRSLKEILLKCSNSKYRLGLTGTLPDKAAKLYGCLAFLGPKVLDIQTKHLIDEGIISDLEIIRILIEYPNKADYSDLDWIEVKQKIIKEPARLELLEKICGSTRKNFLLLVSYVETEGCILERHLKKALPDKEIVFIHGDVKVDIREDVRLSAEHKDNMVIIATYGTFKHGINIRNLHRIVFVSPLKGKIPNLQSLGRVLRALPGKSAKAYDLVDGVKYLRAHGNKRLKIWKKEEFKVRNYLKK